MLLETVLDCRQLIAPGVFSILANHWPATAYLIFSHLCWQYASMFFLPSSWRNIQWQWVSYINAALASWYLITVHRHNLYIHISDRSYDLWSWSRWYVDPCKFGAVDLQSSCWTCLSPRSFFQSQSRITHVRMALTNELLLFFFPPNKQQYNTDK